jgi:cytochrome c553
LSRGSLRREYPLAPPVTAPQAHGNGTFPRLAGQHEAYLVKQMLVIQNALRVAPVMHGVIKDLRLEQVRAVATYLETLNP